MKYPKILSVGDPLIKDLFADDVIVEEKVDGSMFRVGFDAEGKMSMGSKSIVWGDEHPPDKMFSKAVESATKAFEGKDLKNTNVFFEYLKSPHQNTLDYERVPKNHIVLFDVQVDGVWLTPEAKHAFAVLYDFECVPVHYRGKITSDGQFKGLLENMSFLGKEKIEGVVIKNYFKTHSLKYLLGLPLFGKFVREDFKERNAETWKVGVSIEDRVLGIFPKEPRWMKAIQHLREQGVLEDSARDIGKLIPEIARDFGEECKEEVKERLWKEFARKLVGNMVRGFPEFYKNKLVENAFSINKEV